MNTSFKFGEVNTLSTQVEADDRHVNFKNVFETENGGVALLAFKEGQKLETHLAHTQVMVTVLEGEIEFTMIDRVHTIRPNEFLLMGADVPHSVVARKDSKVMLVKVKP